MKKHLLRVGFICLLSLFLKGVNSEARRIKTNTILYPRSFYSSQFKYDKFDPVGEMIRWIGEKYGVSVPISDEARKEIEEKAEELSYEQIRGEIYKSLNNNVLHGLKTRWGLRAKSARERGIRFVNSHLQSQNLNLKQLTNIFMQSDFNLADKNGNLDGKKAKKILNNINLEKELFETNSGALLQKLQNLNQGRIIIIPETVQGLAIDMYVFNELLKDKPNVNVKFLVRNDRMEGFPTVDDFNKIQSRLGINNNNQIQALLVDLSNPGTYLDDLETENKDVANEIQEADLLIIKGATNAVTTQYINKEHFLVGVVDESPQSQYFTGLRWRDTSSAPPVYVAYVPRSIAVAIDYGADIATLQSLRDFVQVELETRENLNTRKGKCI